MTKRLFNGCAVVMFTAISLMMFANPAKANGEVECSDNGVDTAVCVDGYGNASISTIDDEGNQITVDSDGNYEIEFSS